MSIIIDEDTLFETFLSYALYGGAIFQLICILAVIVLPDNDKVKENGKVTDDKAHMASKAPKDMTPHRGRKEKKKHR